ncbi:MAG: SIMPL domain-containing protein [Candidatus Gastranaerophilaceae bacterium]
MDRKITVKGIGNITAKPDYVIINLTIDATNKKYEKAVEEASDKINNLSNALINIGFEKDDLKTSDFRVNVATGYKKNFKGINEMVKTGFTCVNRMRLAFDFDSEKLSKAVETITDCVAEPRLNIIFTVKDEEAVKDELLKSVGANAKRRAEILCESAGGKLGNLITVNYNWNEISILSPTRYHSNDIGGTTGFLFNSAPTNDSMPLLAPKSIQPEDIELSDDAVFVWEIV